MEQKLEELFSEFNQRFGGFVCIDREICMLFMSDVSEDLHTADNLYDYVLSNDLAYEVVE